jgi:hypothetical protein
MRSPRRSGNSLGSQGPQANTNVFAETVFAGAGRDGGQVTLARRGQDAFLQIDSAAGHRHLDDRLDDMERRQKAAVRLVNGQVMGPKSICGQRDASRERSSRSWV